MTLYEVADDSVDFFMSGNTQTLSHQAVLVLTGMYDLDLFV
jgi:hypothetical protein